MKYILLILIFHFTSMNAQNCEGFIQGTFEMKYEYGTVMIERMGDWQLENIDEHNVTYLTKIKKINSCKYELKCHKVLKSGSLPMPDMTRKVTTEIINVEDSNYYFKSSMTGTDMILKGVFIKKSDKISNEFKELIAKEVVN